MSSFDKREAEERSAIPRVILEQGRDFYRQCAWADAFASLSRVDQEMPLKAEDLELLAQSAYLVGRDDEYLRALERAHHAHLDAGEGLRAIDCAFWLGLRLAFRGEMGPATGWFARARRLLEHERHDCVEKGYLLLPVVEQNLAGGDFEAAYAAAFDAAEFGERFHDADLVACARHLQGRVRLKQGQAAEGLALLDEAMVAVTAGELSPLITGLIYCSVIEACQQVYALARAREWTSALTKWCEAQPQLVSFTGSCLVHRAEIMQLSGAWRDAMEEAQRACQRLLEVNNRKDAAAAFYRRAEVHRLSGEFAEAEQAYRSASRCGREPQPGLALLRMAQGRTDAAATAIRRAASTVADPLERTRPLPACIEIALAADDIEEARRGCRELEEVAGSFDSEVLRAMADQARGKVELADGDARAALSALHHALEIWRQVEAPYETARVRVLIGLAFRALGDDDGAALELDSARAALEQLGAVPDLVHVDSLIRGMSADHPHGLTRRELQVLRLVATGKTNKAIADDLCLSKRTIDRHVSNIFDKLNVSSRTAATAFAYQHRLI
jgi:ATP/maltotriose-dependent transcriptional regulator MalT